MNPETLIAMNEGMDKAVLLMLEAVLLIVGGTSILFLICSVVGAICGYFVEMRLALGRQIKRQSEPPEPDEYELLVVLNRLDDGFDDRLTNSSVRRKPASSPQV